MTNICSVYIHKTVLLSVKILYFKKKTSMIIKCHLKRVLLCFRHGFLTVTMTLRSSLNCIHRIASGGYCGFRLVTPMPPPQCVERFHRYRSNEKSIIARLLTFAGYIHNHKILPGNIFGLILKNKMAAMGFFMSADLSGS